MMQENYKRKIIGVAMLCVNALLLLFSTFWFFYQNNKRGSGIFIFFYFPNWVLLVKGLLAITGIVISIRLLKNKISVKRAELLLFLIMILTIVIASLDWLEIYYALGLDWVY